MATNQGPASGNAELILGAGAGNAGSPLEVQVPSGLPSLSPIDAPFVDPGVVLYGSQGAVGATVAAVQNSNVVGVRFAIPA